MPAGSHDDQQFGEFGLSNDAGAARKRAGLAADFEAQVAAKRARIAAQEAAEREAAEADGERADAALEGAGQVAGDSEGQSPDGEQLPSAVEERAFSERVAYGDVRHMSKNFYKGLIASIVVVIVIVAAIIILGRTAL